jgi:hypothetical protein
MILATCILTWDQVEMADDVGSNLRWTGMMSGISTDE